MRLRSLLFAPGNQPDTLAKLPRSGPDGAVLDLEDAVAVDDKAEARQTVAEASSLLMVHHPDVALYVRVNAVPSDWFAQDVAEAVMPNIAGVVVPKLESADHVATVAATLDRHGLETLRIVAGIETAAGVARADDVLSDSRVVAVYFGAEDFIADMGGVRTAEGTEVLYARSRVALAARLNGSLAIDQVVTTLGDEAAFLADTRLGRALGYAGKLCIHPEQVAWAHRAFAPSPEELDRARRLLEAYDRAVASGHAAIAFEGQMIDEPLARQARSLLAAGDA